ncbi:hypothetical protein AAVH_24197 [Aphelenchoides avenae]|nr:hypothetical protein AAVH_24197 [Aphelenchus avenae]
MIPSDTWLDVLQWHFAFALGDLSLISRRFAALISNNAGTLPRRVFTDVRLRPCGYDRRYYYRVTFDDEQRRIRKLGFQMDIYLETLDLLLRMIASSRIEGRLVLQNATVDRNFMDIFHKYAHSIDIAGTLDLRHVTYKPEGIVRELLSSTFRYITMVRVYTATEELLETCAKHGMELRVDTMPALNIITFCFGHPDFATRRCLTVRQAYTTSAFIEHLLQRHKRTPTNIEAELTIRTLPEQNAGRYAFIFDGPNGRLVHDGCALTITRLKGGGLHVKRGKSAKTGSLSLA